MQKTTGVGQIINAIKMQLDYLLTTPKSSTLYENPAAYNQALLTFLNINKMRKS